MVCIDASASFTYNTGAMHKKMKTKQLATLLTQFEHGLQHKTAVHKRERLLLTEWPSIIGPELAPLTRAIAFKQETLYIAAQSTAVVALILRHHRGRILQAYRQCFPRLAIRQVKVRLSSI